VVENLPPRELMSGTSREVGVSAVATAIT